MTVVYIAVGASIIAAAVAIVAIVQSVRAIRAEDEQ